MFKTRVALDPSEVHRCRRWLVNHLPVGTDGTWQWRWIFDRRPGDGTLVIKGVVFEHEEDAIMFKLSNAVTPK